MEHIATLIFLLIVIIVVGVMFYRAYHTPPFTNTWTVPQPPSEVIAGAVAKMAARGHTVNSSSDAMVSFTRTQRADQATGCFLLLLGIIPGLLYFGMFRRTMTTTISVIGREGETLIVLSGDDIRGRKALVRWIEGTLTQPK